VIFVGSTTDQPGTFPANINGVIAATNSETTTANTSNTNSLAAPATHVMTLRPDSQYDFESGTSVAAAEITGVIALLLGADSRLNTQSIVSLLKTSPNPLQPATLDVSGALAKVAEAKGTGRLARSGR